MSKNIADALVAFDKDALLGEINSRLDRAEEMLAKIKVGEKDESF